MTNEILTQSRLKELLHYDPDTGVFTWRKKMARRVKIGDEAGCRHSSGYILIQAAGKLYRAHRLAWLYINGSWPSNQIDHINQNKSDNRIKNLRDVTKSINMRNTKKSKNNSSGITGVSWAANRNKWVAYITVNNRRYPLGYFDCRYKAASARHLAQEINGGFTKSHGV